MNRRSPNRSATPKLRDRLREATAEAILGAAETVFGQAGLHAARMEAIAAEAGVAVGTLYNHFKDRERLLDALVDARRAELLGRLDAALADSRGAPFDAQLRVFVGALTEHFEAHKPYLSIMMEVEASQNCRTFPVAIHKPRQSRRTMEEIHVRVAKLIDRGLAAKALRRNDADIYPTVLMGMVRSFMVRRLFHDNPKPLPLTQRVDQMTRFFLNGAGV